jgi:single-stranded-DNA-specific exonuclease
LEYLWILPKSPEKEKVDNLVKSLGIPEAIARILVNRSIDDNIKAKAFFRPAISQLHDPFLMDGMDKSVERILKAIQNKEKILIFGDCDVDGTCSIAILYLFLKEMGITPFFYVPNRFRYDSGITVKAVEGFKDENISLMITVDCGINAVAPIEYANSINIDTIICDHHIPAEVLPNAFAILNPLKPSCSYPFKHLCGCGVVFKLIEAITKKLNKPTISYPFLQFVAIATMADIVPLNGENRVMVYLGLELINQAPRAGLKALLEVTGLGNKKITSSQIVFILAPRINAVGRLGDAGRAVNLLICDEYKRAFKLAEVLEQENATRSKIDHDTFREAEDLIDKIMDLEQDIPIILHEAEWHPGVIDIVASRLAEKYCRPTIMMTTINGVAKGSARSVDGFDIFEAIKKCEDKVLQFGGHKYAAGLSVEVERIDEFREAFNEIATKILEKKELRPQILIDAEIGFSEITNFFRETLQKFIPYGPSNMRPVFIVKNVEVIGLFKIGGNDRIKMKLRHGNIFIEAIGFNLSEKQAEIDKAAKHIDIIFSVEELDKNYNRQPIQLKLRDFKASLS